MRNGDLFRAALCILLLALESAAFTPSSFALKKTKERVSSLKVEQRDDLQSGYNTDQPYSSFLYSAKCKSRNKKRTEKLQRLLENENDDGYYYHWDDLDWENVWTYMDHIRTGVERSYTYSRINRRGRPRISFSENY